MKTDKTMWTVAFVLAIVLSNIFASRLIDLGEIAGRRLLLPGGIIFYALSFLAINVISEWYGKKQATKMATTGIVAQLVVTIAIILIMILPSPQGQLNTAYSTVFSQTLWVVAGSITAYMVSQTVGITLFHLIKEKTKHKYLYNNISTITAQIIDTVLFSVIAFGVGMGMDANAVISIVIMQVAAKTLLALIDTPFFYLLTRGDECKTLK